MIITMTLTHAGTLSFQVGDRCIDDVAPGMPMYVYPLFDLYGKCDRITILNNDERMGSPLNDEALVGAPVHFASALPADADHNAQPQCEKGNLEVHEKETEAMPFAADGM